VIVEAPTNRPSRLLSFFEERKKQARKKEDFKKYTQVQKKVECLHPQVDPLSWTVVSTFGL